MKPFGALVQPNSKVDLYSQHSFKVDTQGLGHQFTLWLNVMESNDGQLKLAISWKVLPMLLSVQKNKKKILPGLGVFFPNDSLIWLDDPTSKLGLEADMRTLDRVFPW